MDEQESLVTGHMMNKELLEQVRTEAYQISLQTKWKNYRSNYYESFDLSEFEEVELPKIPKEYDVTQIFGGVCECGGLDRLEIKCPAKFIKVSAAKGRMNKKDFYEYILRNKDDLVMKCYNCRHNITI